MILVLYLRRLWDRQDQYPEASLDGLTLKYERPEDDPNRPLPILLDKKTKTGILKRQGKEQRENLPVNPRGPFSLVATLLGAAGGAAWTLSKPEKERRWWDWILRVGTGATAGYLGGQMLYDNAISPDAKLVREAYGSTVS